MISRVYVDPKCFYCGKAAYKVILPSRLVCKECEHNA